MAHLPMAVKIAGSIHGVLFVVFCIALWRAWLGARWPLNRAATLFIAALLPFGPFVIDRRMREWEAEFGAGAAR
jgi:integral membrane protein